MATEEAVIIEFNYGLEEIEPFYDLSDKLRTIVEESNLGEYDGHEMAMDNSDGSFYLYGPDAKKLYEVVKKTIEQTSFMKGANITLRFGPPKPGVKEISFILNLN
jgi:hypothetical protein